jgi:hypothetical protein
VEEDTASAVEPVLDREEDREKVWGEADAEEDREEDSQTISLGM